MSRRRRSASAASGWSCGSRTTSLPLAQAERVVAAALAERPPTTARPLPVELGDDRRFGCVHDVLRLVEQLSDAFGVGFVLDLGPRERTDLERLVDDRTLVPGAAVGAAPRGLGGQIEGAEPRHFAVVVVGA